MQTSSLMRTDHCADIKLDENMPPCRHQSLMRTCHCADRWGRKPSAPKPSGSLTCTVAEYASHKLKIILAHTVTEYASHKLRIILTCTVIECTSATYYAQERWCLVYKNCTQERWCFNMGTVECQVCTDAEHFYQDMNAIKVLCIVCFHKVCI